MKRILITIVLASILPFSATVSADEYRKEERKYHQEREREERKHYEEQERESRKFYEEQEREARKHREEREREERKHYEEQEYDAKQGKYEKHKRHEYRYYPRSSVYYDEKKKVYFYLEGDKWGVSVNLPGGINLGVQDYVTIQTDKDRPYADEL